MLEIKLDPETGDLNQVVSSQGQSVILGKIGGTNLAFVDLDSGFLLKVAPISIPAGVLIETAVNFSINKPLCIENLVAFIETNW